MRSSVSESDVDLPEKIRLRSTILACTQVSQLWRHAARGYSPLWVHAVDIQARSPHVVGDLLQLSRPHPIVVGHRLAPFRVSTARDFAVLYHSKKTATASRSGMSTSSIPTSLSGPAAGFSAAQARRTSSPPTRCA
ncbi:hypothetical protein FA13DRAFT_1735299 [Coprinellus micaceus]|uniref:Uncharacterized protein n=1 Tax=Coprinellus micaceus TaxID=71717 RepID=A0A4Y7T498_COPMI|nr:hypothetical protein FA13DRAFT_1741322 [Coprinellus micaceus]TEB28774.1 hypothetical protein FA13DRAFT_1735299 [Coprinellus micaceus]